METKLKRPMSFLLAFVVAMVFNFPIGITNGLTGIFDFGLPAKAEDITPTPPEKGDGSSSNPYEITKAEELYWFAELVNNGMLDSVTSGRFAHAKLMADITVNTSVLNTDGTLNTENTTKFIPWTPISYYNDEYDKRIYVGTFDGQGHTISGLYFNDNSKDNVGLFGYNAGTIKNVGVVGSYFYGKENVGGVCGYNYSNSITSCYNTGAVTGSSNVGGVCGYIGGGSITSCYNTGAVSGAEHVGGVSGCNSSGTVKNCYNTGKVTGEEKVGGVSGSNYSGSIENCYNTGAVSGKSYFGSVCGYYYMGEIRNCYYSANSETDYLSGTTYKTDGQFTSGEVCYLLNGSTAENERAWGQNLGSSPDDLPVLKNSTNNAPAVYKYCNRGDSGYSNENKGNEHDFSAGQCKCGEYESATLNGTYYEIDTVSKLYWFAAQVNSGNNTINAKLTKDINVNGSSETVDVADCEGKKGEGWTDWTPIGNDSYKYTGIFDGDGHTISGLYFNNPGQHYVGLFGYVDSGTVKNVNVIDSYFNGSDYVGGVCGFSSGTLTSCSNTGAVSGGSPVGGVCGYSRGTLTSCSNSGKVTGSGNVGGVCGSNSNGALTSCSNTGTVTDSDTGNHVGGVCGYSDGTVTSCYNEGAVTGEGKGSYVGGVIGFNNEGSITSCYNKGAITGTSSGQGYVGGVIGYNNSATITNCYNKGVVKGVVTGDVTRIDASNAGGVIGYNKSGTITSCYNTGEVTGTNESTSMAYAGGVIGANDSGEITSCYSTGAVTGSSNVGGVIGSNGSGSITHSYYNSTVYTGGKAVGNVDNTDNVTGKDTTAFESGEVCYLLNGSTSESSESKKLAWGQLLSGDANADKSPVHLTTSNAGTHTVYGGYTTCDEKVPMQYANEPIGTAERPAHNYKDNNGFCKGCGSYEPAAETNGVYEISNAGQLYWFAAQVNSGNTTINAKLTANINVNGDSEKVDVANCSTRGEGWIDWTPIGNKEKPYKGTFDGDRYTISGLYLKTFSQDYVGLFGYVDSGTVKDVGVIDSYFYGRNYVGGVIGYNKGGTITSCSNTGKVTANISYVGGVCSYNKGGTITYSFNHGAVKGSSGVGGVCGNNYKNFGVGGAITSCYNTGAVTGSSGTTGGVIGYNQDGTIEDCYNEGAVTGTGSGEGYAGGVIGSNVSGTITNCYNKGVVTGTNSSTSRGMAYAGGVIGKNERGSITNCYNTGAITGTSMAYAGGVIGSNDSGAITSCYSSGTITSDASNAGGVIGSNGSGTITSCYYDSEICKNMTAVGGDVADTADVTGKDTTAFTGGEVCYLLNGSTSEGENLVWGQTLGADASPVFHNGNNTVYLATGCQVYSNAPTKDHVIGSDGSCKDCKYAFVKFSASSSKVTGWTKNVYEVNNGVIDNSVDPKSITLADGTSLITCTFNHDESITNVVYYTIEITQGEKVIAKTGMSVYKKMLGETAVNIDMAQIAYMLENGNYTAILKLYDESKNDLYTKTMGFSVTDTATEGNEAA